MHYSFDFDYTLADSSTGTIECASHALRSLRLPVAPEEEIRKTIGLSLEKTFARLAKIEDNPSLAAEFKRLFLERAEIVMLDHIRLYQSAPYTLSTLKKQGHYISIVSTKFRARLTEAIKRDELVELVDYIVGGDEVTRNKPDPEGLLMAIESSNLAKSETIYVGDSESDGECAQRAGVGFIAVTTGTTSPAHLGRWSPVSVIPDLTHLL